MTVQYMTIVEMKDPNITYKVKDYTAMFGWKMQVEWKYRSTSWVPLKD